jgi:hypothetical protein
MVAVAIAADCYIMQKSVSVVVRLDRRLLLMIHTVPHMTNRLLGYRSSPRSSEKSNAGRLLEN